MFGDSWKGENVKLIPLNNSRKMVFVDDEDYDILRIHTWNVINNGAVQTIVSSDSKHLILAREILKTSNLVDHKNHDIFDNQKFNLREADYSQNIANSKKHKDNTTGYKGVCWHKSHKKFLARIMVYGDRIHLGYFNSKEEAAIAYNKAAKEHFGEFALLNEVTI